MRINCSLPNGAFSRRCSLRMFGESIGGSNDTKPALTKPENMARSLKDFIYN
jgi:hypothetical protein